MCLIESVTTTSVCLNCPIIIEDRQFCVNLICLPMVDLDVILGINWLSKYHVMLNCHDKTIVFQFDLIPNPQEEFISFISSNQIIASLRGGAQ